MELSALSDAQLVDLARGGSAPAFAVLLHRHGPAVRAVVAADPDPTGAVIGTYVAAMRELDREPQDPERTRGWLLGLAADQVGRPAQVGDEPLPDLDPDELDEVWAELDLRWPDGRARRHLPAWLGWAALVVALVALGVVVPYVALTWGAADAEDDEWEVLRAEPFEHEEFERAEAPELAESDDAGEEFELPSLDFAEPEAAPEPEPEPEPEAQPEPEPEPEPEPVPAAEPTPEEPETSGAEPPVEEEPVSDGDESEDAGDIDEEEPDEDEDDGGSDDDDEESEESALGELLDDALRSP